MAFKPKGFQQITDLSSATGLTVPAGAQYARIQCTAQAVRWRDDGVNPSATVGMSLSVNTDLWYEGDVNALAFIEVTSGAVLNVSFYG